MDEDDDKNIHCLFIEKKRKYFHNPINYDDMIF